MKLKIIVKFVEQLLRAGNPDEPHADMYLPERLLAMALVMLAGGTACAIFAVFRFSVGVLIGAAVALGFGIIALLCWKNQSIRIISGEEFEYTTFLGNKRLYRFSDIKGLRKNQDSLTLFVGDDKVHIESMAVISERLANSINKELEKLH